jgi:uncharacterized protein YdeI (YjbR/CyaY-like superfamily)
MTPSTFFASAPELHQWLEANHDTTQELWIGFYKTGSGKPRISYAEALDEALCFGWIDGIRKKIDEASYTIRFGPRRPQSMWSKVNITRVKALIAQGRMQPSGLAAFQTHDEQKADAHSLERQHARLDEQYEVQLKAHPAAWAFFQAQAPGYQRIASLWVMDAKKVGTRQKRLNELIEESANGRKVRAVTLEPRPKSER